MKNIVLLFNELNGDLTDENGVLIANMQGCPFQLKLESEKVESTIETFKYYQLLRLETLKEANRFHSPSTECTTKMIIDTAKQFFDFLTI